MCRWILKTAPKEYPSLNLLCLLTAKWKQTAPSENPVIYQGLIVVDSLPEVE